MQGPGRGAKPDQKPRVSAAPQASILSQNAQNRTALGLSLEVPNWAPLCAVGLWASSYAAEDGKLGMGTIIGGL